MMADRPALVSLYLLSARLLTPAYHLLQWSRLRKGKDDPARKGERFGIASRPRPQGPLIWVHAASVGETNSILPLIRRLTAEGRQVLLTTVTRTAADIAEKQLPQRAIHQYACFDHPGFWRKFLTHWQPDLALTVESEIWPACFEALKEIDCPLCLINARMSDGSFRNWSRLGKAAHHVFGNISLVLAQSEADGERLKTLGCKEVELPGNLKFDAIPAAPDQTAVDELKAAIGSRPFWLAALTHPGEDEVVLAAHKVLRETHPDLLLMLVPRHPVRVTDVAQLCEADGYAVARRSAEHVPAATTDVFIGDTLGEMNLYYAVSDTVFLAGSFAMVGGHNPVEPASFDCAIVSGPNVANARSVYKTLWEGEAIERVSDADELAPAIAKLLDDAELRAHYASRAKAFIEQGRGALEKTLEHLARFLPAND